MQCLRVSATMMAFAVASTVLPACGGSVDTSPPPADSNGSIALTVSPTTIVETPSGSAATTVTIVRNGGFSGSVSLAVPDIPAGLSATFAAPTLSPSETSTGLTIAASSSIAAGTYAVTFHASGTGVSTQSAVLMVTISPPVASQKLTVTMAGTGSGSIKSNTTAVFSCTSTDPAGCTASFPFNTNIGLVATPNAGSVFTGWEGDCDGSVVCTFFMDRAHRVKATFVRASSAVAASVTVTPMIVPLKVGQDLPLTATVRDSAGNILSGQPITWESMDPNVVTVSQSGVLHGVANSLAVIPITVKIGDVVGTARIVVATTFLSVTQVSVSNGSACAVEQAGGLYCWGSNSGGQLGRGPNQYDETVVGLVSGGLPFTRVAIGSGMTCALTSTDHPYCWGAIADTTRLGSVTIAPLPVPVRGSMTFSQIVTPVTATGCGLTASGSTYCWGINNFGDLGIANPDHLSIDPLPVPNAPAFTMLAMGSGLTTNVRACGITAAKAVYCWGDNPNGQLGDGSLTRRPTPAVVSGGHAFTAIALGQMSSCALDTDGNAFCWGDNHSGELGDGTTTSRTVPTAVAGGLHFISIAVGSAHACGITTDHEAYCWGNNNFDQLGDGGTLLSQSVPGPVLGGIRFTSVVSQATSDDTCGIAVGGGVYCWGGNRGGELGYIHQEGPSGYPVPIGRP